MQRWISRYRTIPNFRFFFNPQGKGELKIEVEDTHDPQIHPFGADIRGGSSARGLIPGSGRSKGRISVDEGIRFG